MTTLKVCKIPVSSVDMNMESTLPMLYEVTKEDSPMKSSLPEEDGLYLRYRFIKSAFPYRAQDNYSRNYVTDKIEAVVLENEYLKATFVPSSGGKLWSLYDKVAEKELLFNNPVRRPAYLATRNAWCSGGVEWNCGIYGHTPLTCSQLFTGTLTGPEGEPILRMYEFERVRGVVYQMDFSLPEGSKVLFARMRVVNPSYRDTAMYWWSNIAVPEVKGARVVAPASQAYSILNGEMHLVDVPMVNGNNVTYPEQNPISVDYFFKTEDTQKYVCQLSTEGYGLFQSSTSALKGRKLFVWGQGPGGRKWQEYLSGNGNPGRYCEIQCGLASTQLECVPMPPATAWEWLEIYGPLQAEPSRVHGSWEEAKAEVAEKVAEIMSLKELEQRLIDTREYALRPTEQMLCYGSGWGALENIRRETEGLSSMCAHLDFGKPGYEQEAWLNLLHNGSMGEQKTENVPTSWMRQKEWVALMEAASIEQDQENWYTLLQLGCTYLAEADLFRAEYYLKKSLEAERSAWALYAMGEYYRICGKDELAAEYMVEAADQLPEDESLAKMAARNLQKIGAYEKLLAFTENRSERILEFPRMRLYRIFALVHFNRLDEAEKILCRDGAWLEVPDLQEGELSLSDLWYEIQEKRAVQRGEAFDREAVSPPYELDFRMFAK